MAERLARRSISIPALLVTAAVGTTLAVVALPGLAAFEAVVGRLGRFARTRLLMFLVALLAVEVFAIAAAGVLWIRFVGRLQSSRSQVVHRRVQRGWAASVAAIASGLLGARLPVLGRGGSDGDPLASGSSVCIARHSSYLDALVPMVLILCRHGREVRYCIARELRWVPSLDLFGHRLPNHFVDRRPGSGQTDQLRNLGSELGDGSTVIFPEGNFFTPERKRRVIKRLAESDRRAADAAAELQHLLPPRPAGTLALLEAAPEADLVAVVHRGLERFSSFGSLWQQPLQAEPIQVEAWIYPTEDLPAGQAARTELLSRIYTRMDRWISARS